MPSINDVYGSGLTYQASDLTPGAQADVQISGVRFKTFDDGNKLEISFAGQEKMLICNKTNAGRIAQEHGEDYEQWVGKTISLEQDMTEFQGKPMPCVRVVPHVRANRLQQPTPAAPAAPAAPASQPLTMPVLQAAIDKCRTPDELLALVEKGATGDHLPQNIPLFTQFIEAAGRKTAAEIQGKRWLEVHTKLLDDRIEWLHNSLTKQEAPADALAL